MDARGKGGKILYNLIEALATGAMAEAMTAAREADLVVAVGSTLSVAPVNMIVPMAKQAGAGVVIVNGSETVMDDSADFLLRGSISEILPRLFGAT